MAVNITTVNEKGAPLSASEFDANFVNLKTVAEANESALADKLGKTEQAADSEKLQGKIPGTEIGNVVVQGDKYVKSGNSSLYTPSEFTGLITINSGVWGVDSGVVPNAYLSNVTITGTYYDGVRYNPFFVIFGVSVNSDGSLLTVQNVLKSNKDIPFKVYRLTGSNRIKAIFELSSSFAYLRINVSSINSSTLGIPDTLNWVATDSVIDYTAIVPTETKSLMNAGDFGYSTSHKGSYTLSLVHPIWRKIARINTGASSKCTIEIAYGYTPNASKYGKMIVIVEPITGCKVYVLGDNYNIPAVRYVSGDLWLGTVASGSTYASYHAYGSSMYELLAGTESSSNPGGTNVSPQFIVSDTEVQTLTNKSFGSHILPSSDNSINLGSASLRFGTVYAGTGAINTSDAREKTSIVQFTENEINASIHFAQEIGTYQFLDSIETKGESARVHVGMTVQRAIEIMEAHGLDPFRYGFICFDEWQDEYIEHSAEYEQIDIPAVLDEDGNEIEPARYEQGNIIKEAWQEQTQKAGSRFGFRTDQLLMFIIKGQGARIARIENRLKALEGFGSV